MNDPKAHTRKPHIDLDAVICLDMSHQWRLLEEATIKKQSLYRGCRTRSKLCMVCGSLKVETIGWNGYVLTRSYQPDPVYLENARKVASLPNERRAAYRRMLLGRAPANACLQCGLVHESADCPDW